MERVEAIYIKEKSSKFKSYIITSVSCLLIGFIIGVSGYMVFNGRVEDTTAEQRRVVAELKAEQYRVRELERRERERITAEAERLERERRIFEQTNSDVRKLEQLDRRSVDIYTLLAEKLKIVEMGYNRLWDQHNSAYRDFNSEVEE